jgi:hypothetical protein
MVEIFEQAGPLLGCVLAQFVIASWDCTSRDLLHGNVSYRSCMACTRLSHQVLSACAAWTPSTGLYPSLWWQPFLFTDINHNFA